MCVCVWRKSHIVLSKRTLSCNCIILNQRCANNNCFEYNIKLDHAIIY